VISLLCNKTAVVFASQRSFDSPEMDPMAISDCNNDGILPRRRRCEKARLQTKNKFLRQSTQRCTTQWHVHFTLGIVVALLCVSPSGTEYTGYPGYWIFGEEYQTPWSGPEVLSRIIDPISPCRFDGTQCTRSQNVYSEPGEFRHDTGRSVCVERARIPLCRTRMFNFGYVQRVDPLRQKGVYPAQDGHTSTTLVSGVNFNGELGIGTRNAVHSPVLQNYFKLGDSKYEQLMGAGRGFKNLSFVNIGYEHAFGIDQQRVFYAWGNNEYGQLGIQTNQFPNGHRYKSLWPQPVAFFRPFYYYLCNGGIDNLKECNGEGDTVSCLGAGAFCQAGQNQVAYRRNAFSASKLPFTPAHSAVVTEYTPLGCFDYSKFLDEFNQDAPDASCTGGGKLFVWGYNMNGQIGIGNVDENFITAPREVSVGEKWYSVAVGGQHTVATTVCVCVCCGLCSCIMACMRVCM
jgi:hypothetical protein